MNTCVHLFVFCVSQHNVGVTVVYEILLFINNINCFLCLCVCFISFLGCAYFLSGLWSAEKERN